MDRSMDRRMDEWVDFQTVSEQNLCSFYLLPIRKPFIAINRILYSAVVIESTFIFIIVMAGIHKTVGLNKRPCRETDADLIENSSRAIGTFFGAAFRLCVCRRHRSVLQP